MDKYDLAIEYLTAHPDKIFEAWFRPHRFAAGCLFLPAVRLLKGNAEIAYPTRPDGRVCACLTDIRKHGDLTAHTDEIEAQIRADNRIPDNAYAITVESLPVFAEWQRRLDKEFGEYREVLPCPSDTP